MSCLRISFIILLCISVFAISGCKTDYEKDVDQVLNKYDAIIGPGDRVAVYFTAKKTDGTVFAQTTDKPLVFNVGETNSIPHLNKIVQGMRIGEKKTVVYEPEEAFGVRNEALMRKFKPSDIPSNVKLEVGAIIRVNDGQGNSYPAMVRRLTDEEVIVDLNHPLAGETVEYTVEVARSATQ